MIDPKSLPRHRRIMLYRLRITKRQDIFTGQQLSEEDEDSLETAQHKRLVHARKFTKHNWNDKARDTFARLYNKGESPSHIRRTMKITPAQMKLLKESCHRQGMLLPYKRITQKRRQLREFKQMIRRSDSNKSPFLCVI